MMNPQEGDAASTDLTHCSLLARSTRSAVRGRRTTVIYLSCNLFPATATGSQAGGGARYWAGTVTTVAAPLRPLSAIENSRITTPKVSFERRSSFAIQNQRPLYSIAT